VELKKFERARRELKENANAFYQIHTQCRGSLRSTFSQAGEKQGKTKINGNRTLASSETKLAERLKAPKAPPTSYDCTGKQEFPVLDPGTRKREIMHRVNAIKKSYQASDPDSLIAGSMPKLQGNRTLN